MRTVDSEMLKTLPVTDPKVLVLYGSIQDELCNVIEEAGAALSIENSHQLYDAIAKIAAESPKKYVLDFVAPPVTQPWDSWKQQRLTKMLDGFQLMPLDYWAISFRYTHLTNGLIQSSDVIRLMYQEKTGTWISAATASSDSIPNASISSDSLGLALLPGRPTTQHPDATFYLDISPSGYLSVNSCTLDFLEPTRLIFSDFQFTRRNKA